MRYIDAFCYFFASGILRLMSEARGGMTDVGKHMQGAPTVHDLDGRFRDRPPEFVRVANDGLAELVEKYPQLTDIPSRGDALGFAQNDNDRERCSFAEAANASLGP